MKYTQSRKQRSHVKVAATALVALVIGGLNGIAPVQASNNNNSINQQYSAGVPEQLLVPNELIVEVDPSLGCQNIENLFKRENATYYFPIGSEAWHVKFANKTDQILAWRHLSKENKVISIGYNFKVTQCGNSAPVDSSAAGTIGSGQTQAAAGDPQYSSEWHIAAVKAGSNQPKPQIHSFNGFAIMDNGVVYRHANEDSALSMNYDIHMGGENASWTESADHGTMIATTLGAKWNHFATAGVVRDPRIVSARLSFDGKGEMTEADLITGLGWAKGYIGDASTNYPSAMIIPLNIIPPYSLSNQAYHPAFHHLCKNIHDKFSGLVFLSAGNNGMYDASPRVDYINVVGACDQDGKLLPNSNRGKCMTMIAPGKDIICTQHNGQLVSGNGTSFSAAIAAGVAGLIHNKGREYGKFLKNTEIDYVLKATCSLKPAAGWSDTTGYGMPDYKAATNALK